MQWQRLWKWFKSHDHSFQLQVPDLIPFCSKTTSNKSLELSLTFLAASYYLGTSDTTSILVEKLLIRRVTPRAETDWLRHSIGQDILQGFFISWDSSPHPFHYVLRLLWYFSIVSYIKHFHQMSPTDTFPKSLFRGIATHNPSLETIGLPLQMTRTRSTQAVYSSSQGGGGETGGVVTSTRISSVVTFLVLASQF